MPTQYVETNSCPGPTARMANTTEFTLWIWRKQEKGQFPGIDTRISVIKPQLHEVRMRAYMTANKTYLFVDLVHVLETPLPQWVDMHAVARAAGAAIRKQYPHFIIKRITPDIIDTEPLHRFD